MCTKVGSFRSVVPTTSVRIGDKNAPVNGFEPGPVSLAIVYSFRHHTYGSRGRGRKAGGGTRRFEADW
jgi:hypothetical protein